MKLHTDFHDYYDTAVGFGVDANVHYNRYTKEVEIKFDAKYDLPPFLWDSKSLLLGFCGQVYPVIQINERDENHQIINRHFAYTYEEMLHPQINWTKFTHNHKRAKIQVKQFFIDWHEQNEEIFLKYKVPLWILELDRYDQKITLNPKLETYQFQRIKDAITAFQEISMYLSNILVEQKETAIIEDKYRIVQHGFDAETSFRRGKKD